MLFPTISNIEKVDVPSFEGMIAKFISQAIHRKEIQEGSVQELTRQVVAAIYGSLMVAQAQRVAQVKDFCKTSWSVAVPKESVELADFITTESNLYAV